MSYTLNTHLCERNETAARLQCPTTLSKQDWLTLFPYRTVTISISPPFTVRPHLAFPVLSASRVHWLLLYTGDVHPQVGLQHQATVPACTMTRVKTTQSTNTRNFPEELLVKSRQLLPLTPGIPVYIRRGAGGFWADEQPESVDRSGDICMTRRLLWGLVAVPPDGASSSHASGSRDSAHASMKIWISCGGGKFIAVERSRVVIFGRTEAYAKKALRQAKGESACVPGVCVACVRMCLPLLETVLLLLPAQQPAFPTRQ